MPRVGVRAGGNCSLCGEPDPGAAQGCPAGLELLQRDPRACTRARVPVAMNRCVARRSCGEIFTFISLSESLKMEKSWGLRPRWGTRSFFRLSAAEQRAEQLPACSSHKGTAAAGSHTACTRMERGMSCWILWQGCCGAAARAAVCTKHAVRHSLGNSSLGRQQGGETCCFLRNKSWAALAGCITQSWKGAWEPPIGTSCPTHVSLGQALPSHRLLMLVLLCLEHSRLPDI